MGSVGEKHGQGIFRCVYAEITHVNVPWSQGSRLRARTTDRDSIEARCTALRGQYIQRLPIGGPGRSWREVLITNIAVGPVHTIPLEFASEICGGGIAGISREGIEGVLTSGIQLGGSKKRDGFP